MSRQVLVPGAFALALCTAIPAHAASDADLAEIRAEIQSAQAIVRSKRSTRSSAG